MTVQTANINIEKWYSPTTTSLRIPSVRIQLICSWSPKQLIMSGNTTRIVRCLVRCSTCRDVHNSPILSYVHVNQWLVSFLLSVLLVVRFGKWDNEQTNQRSPACQVGNHFTICFSWQSVEWLAHRRSSPAHCSPLRLLLYKMTQPSWRAPKLSKEHKLQWKLFIVVLWDLILSLIAASWHFACTWGGDLETHPTNHFVVLSAGTTNELKKIEMRLSTKRSLQRRPEIFETMQPTIADVLALDLTRIK